MNAHMNTFAADAPIRFNHKINLIAGRDRLLVESLIHRHPSYAGHGQSGAAWDEILKKVNDAGGKGNEIGVSTLKQRHKNLVKQFKARQAQEKKMTWSNESYSDLDQLLFQLVELEAEGDRGKAMKKQLTSEEEVQKQAAADKVVERATLLKSKNPLRVVEQKKWTDKVEGSSSGHLVGQSTVDFSDAREMLKSFRDELSSMVAGISDGEVLTSMRRLEENVERGFLAIETRQRTLEQRQTLLEERQARFEYNMQRYLL
ncbi:hypothetical protein PHYBLDRAFT_182583 [Phycomyces blakesleeanus NRRL 1555(-)]|uniref:Uncharacterized protein n=1 Tax=Phycomyces blakesleeanus (strain ATCC 8743b / DSM 1359 / FGSC 10004 / NBRC 33097 / NRRL 1555) TaxID=763407 RepID=A0A167LFE3_PHYB8|nr:hypothetical protein PHYBLDRAFT_182583 [Phycomyces blakesleeanus NRRL 1555(-)]OAD70335.1 hypothetical protein PHYBLDRAFT_182583 [Phycomyces blakesleeanus NRRL 1555(-)]|eukprot:XP_018288375.1 hypothetical protein PHYBLDRAFT_182583 [Phycomyces blakesleeanus NRRL 1555(-)]